MLHASKKGKAREVGPGVRVDPHDWRMTNGFPFRYFGAWPRLVALSRSSREIVLIVLADNVQSLCPTGMHAHAYNVMGASVELEKSVASRTLTSEISRNADPHDSLHPRASTVCFDPSPTHIRERVADDVCFRSVSATSSSASCPSGTPSRTSSSRLPNRASTFSRSGVERRLRSQRETVTRREGPSVRVFN